MYLNSTLGNITYRLEYERKLEEILPSAFQNFRISGYAKSITPGSLLWAISSFHTSSLWGHRMSRPHKSSVGCIRSIGSSRFRNKIAVYLSDSANCVKLFLRQSSTMESKPLVPSPSQTTQVVPEQRRSIPFRNLAVGSVMSMFQGMHE